MTKPYQALIFDWDGTLADSISQIVRSLQYAHHQVGLPELDAHRARQVIGLNLTDALRRTAPQASAQQIDALVYHYRRHYFNPQTQASLFAAAKTWLPELQQHFWLAVATGKSRDGLDKALRETAAAPYFLATRTVSECAAKPNPDMVLSICDEFGLHPQDVLVVGDTTHDLLMAANAGADAVAVSTGAHSADTLLTVPQMAILDGIDELAHWLGLSSGTASFTETHA